MRTLKKTLCLVLCLAMMVGLCAIGANAIEYKDYPDKAKIEHEEAVQLLTALGVLQGDAKGYRPGDTLTRAEGAKIVVALQRQLNPQGASTFADMAGYEWAQPYVGFLQALGHVEGTGDNKFNPGGTLTFAEFAAMLLRALGYDKDREYMTGASYEIGVARLVNKMNLAEDIDKVDYKAPITRDDAAQLAFNLLTKTVVSYSGRLTLDKNGNLALDAEPTENIAYDYQWNWFDDDEAEVARTTLQFCESFWPELKHAWDWDTQGRRISVWFMGKNQNDMAYFPSKVIASALVGKVLANYDRPAETTVGTVWNDAGWVDNANYDLDVWENGYMSAYVLADDASMINVRRNGTATLPYPGTTATLFDSDKDGLANWIDITFAYLGKVIDIIPETRSASGRREIEIQAFDGENTSVFYETDNYSKGDYVLVYPYTYIGGAADMRSDYAWAVESVEPISGKVTKVGLDDGNAVSLTVNGTTYPIAVNGLTRGNGMEIMDAAATQYVLGKEYTLFLANGAVLGVSTEGPSYASYVFYMNVRDDVEFDNYDVERPYTAGQDAVIDVMTIGYVKQDGSTGTAKVSKYYMNSDGKYTDAQGNVLADQNDAAARVENPLFTEQQFGWVKITTWKNGLNGVKKVADYNPATKALGEFDLDAFGPEKNIKRDLPGALTDNNALKIVTDNKTIFILYTDYKTFEVYTGVSTLPSWTVEEAVPVYSLVVNGFAYAVFVDLHEATLNVAAPTEKIFLLSDSPIEKAYDEKNDCIVYTYEAIVDGQFGTVDALVSGEGDDVFAAVGLVAVIRDPKTGYITGVTAIAQASMDFTNSTYEKIVWSNDTVIINGKAYLTDKNTKVFYLGPDKIIAGGDAIDLAGRQGMAWVYYATGSAVAAEIYVIYVTNQVEAQ